MPWLSVSLPVTILCPLCGFVTEMRQPSAVA
jgi:hypothetical protein